jgi:hypothetical protein
MIDFLIAFLLTWITHKYIYALSALILKGRDFLTAHIQKKRGIYLLLAPFFGTAAVFCLFTYFINPGKGLPATITERGTFGDSFGILNSLFSGLGFAGLTLTLWMQQKQIKSQATEAQKADEARQIDRYEATIHRLLDLYRACMNDVHESRSIKPTKGRLALAWTVDYMQRSLERKKDDIDIPKEIFERYATGTLNETDKLLLDESFFNIASIINETLQQHRSLTDTFTLLLRQLVDAPPTFLGLEPYLLLVKSQISPAEMSYYFYLALAFQDEEELRRLLAGSQLLGTISKVTRIPQAHQLLYLRLWGENPAAVYAGNIPHKPFCT